MRGVSMHSRPFSYFSALVAFVLMFTLTKPVVAYADDGQPGDPTPEATGQTTTDESGSVEDSAPTEVEESTPAEETATEEFTAGPSAPPEELAPTEVPP